MKYNATKTDIIVKYWLSDEEVRKENWSYTEEEVPAQKNICCKYFDKVQSHNFDSSWNQVA